MKYSSLIRIFIGVLFSLHLCRADPSILPDKGFDSVHYEGLWSKSPFAVASPEIETKESSDYSLVGVAQFEGIFYVSLVDKQNREHFLLSTGKPIRGLTLVSVTKGKDRLPANAIIQKNGQDMILSLESVSTPMAQVVNFSLPLQSPISQPLPAPGSSGLAAPPGGALPLAFHSIPPDAVPLTDQQKAIVEKLRKNFVSEVGDNNQNASNPDYLQRWKKAQINTDQQMKAMLGREVYSQLQTAH